MRGSKNAALPALAATILSKRPCVLDNLPLIGDIFTLISTLQAMGSKIEWLEKHRIRIDNSRLSPDKMPRDLICKIRASVLLLGPILARFGEVRISTPGGCHIGPRPIDIHLDAFRELGFAVHYSESQDIYHIWKERRNTKREVTMKGLTVTGTENLLMYAALHPLKIKIAAIEPHIEDLGRLLVKMGAKINGFGSHTLEIKKPIKQTGGIVRHSVMYDPIEAGTFIILAAATKSDVLVKNVPIEDLTLTLRKLEEFGVKFEIRAHDVFVRGSVSKLVAVPRLVAQEHPGIPTDLQAPFGVLATQAKGETLIFDTIYEGRLKYLYELDKMGASVDILDPHRARIKGPTGLVGKNVESIDLRAGATLIIAALVARGESVLHQAEQIDRGYEEIDERLRMIKADIRRAK